MWIWQGMLRPAETLLGFEHGEEVKEKLDQKALTKEQASPVAWQMVGMDQSMKIQKQKRNKRMM